MLILVLSAAASRKNDFVYQNASVTAHKPPVLMMPVKSLLVLLLSMAACTRTENLQSQYTAFTGATIIDGTGAEPFRDGVLLVAGGRVIAVGARDAVDIPDGASIKDVSGKTIIPGIINAHGHVGNAKGIEGGHYSRENVIDNLSIYARYGVTTVVSLGDDKKEGVPLRHVNDSTAMGRARLFIAGDVITGNTPEQAIAMVDRNHRMGVDFMKIRVDDNLGAGKKMSEDVYRAVIDRSHELGYKIATHMYYLEDAKKLLEAGSDLIAHSVRDVAVDEAFIQLIKSKGVGYCPTLTREVSTFVYGDTADFFSDPFFTREYDTKTVAPLMDPARQQQVRNSSAARTYKQQLPVAMANLKTLSDAGVPIVFGTDSGVPTRFMGYFEHMEMKMMQDAGLTPMQIIVSASKNAATYMGLKDLGSLTQGHWADFIVLDADPLADIRNARKISAVYVGADELKD
jgi:imidazolonepropionase-like amidohydrolase